MERKIQNDLGVPENMHGADSWIARLCKIDDASMDVKRSDAEFNRALTQALLTDQSQQPKTDYKPFYVIGGVIVLLSVVALIILNKR